MLVTSDVMIISICDPLLLWQLIGLLINILLDDEELIIWLILDDDEVLVINGLDMIDEAKICSGEGWYAGEDVMLIGIVLFGRVTLVVISVIGTSVSNTSFLMDDDIIDCGWLLFKGWWVACDCDDNNELVFEHSDILAIDSAFLWLAAFACPCYVNNLNK